METQPQTQERIDNYYWSSSFRTFAQFCSLYDALGEAVFRDCECAYGGNPGAAIIMMLTPTQVNLFRAYNYKRGQTFELRGDGLRLVVEGNRSFYSGFLAGWRVVDEAADSGDDGGSDGGRKGKVGMKMEPAPGNNSREEEDAKTRVNNELEQTITWVRDAANEARARRIIIQRIAAALEQEALKKEALEQIWVTLERMIREAQETKDQEVQAWAKRQAEEAGREALKRKKKNRMG